MNVDEKNEKSKVLIKGKVAEYLERAEMIKEHIKNGPKSTRKAVAANGSGNTKE